MSTSSFSGDIFLEILDDCQSANIPVSHLLSIINKDREIIFAKDNIEELLTNVGKIVDIVYAQGLKPYQAFIINEIQNFVNAIILYNAHNAKFIKTQAEAERLLDQAERTTSVMTTINKRNTDIINKHDEKINRLLPQFVTIVGIFIAIIMVMFGGLNIFSALANLENVSPLRLTGAGTLIAFLISNSMFLLIYLLSRLTNRPIHTVCVYFDNEKITNPL